MARRKSRRYRTTAKQKVASKRNLIQARKKRNRRLAIGGAAVGVLAVSVGAAVIFGRRHSGPSGGHPMGVMGFKPKKANPKNKIVPKRVLVSGSRNWSDAGTIHTALNEMRAVHGEIIVVHGGAKGADSIADSWARLRDVPVEVYPAQWDKYGKAAGMKRNQQMLDTGIDVVAAFPLGRSPGTRGMMRIATSAGVKVRNFAD